MKILIGTATVIGCLQKQQRCFTSHPFRKEDPQKLENSDTTIGFHTTALLSLFLLQSLYGKGTNKTRTAGDEICQALFGVRQTDCRKENQNP